MSYKWSEAELERYQTRRATVKTETATLELSSASVRRTSRPRRLKNVHGAGHNLKAIPFRSETAFQMGVVKHLKQRRAPGVVFFHPPNESVRSKEEAGKLVAMGMLPGVPDICLVIDGRFYGLELKHGKGVPSPDQRDCHAAIVAAGGHVATAWELDAALRILISWGAISPASSERRAEYVD